MCVCACFACSLGFLVSNLVVWMCCYIKLGYVLIGMNVGVLVGEESAVQFQVEIGCQIVGV